MARYSRKQFFWATHSSGINFIDQIGRVPNSFETYFSMTNILEGQFFEAQIFWNINFPGNYLDYQFFRGKNVQKGATLQDAEFSRIESF